MNFESKEQAIEVLISAGERDQHVRKDLPYRAEGWQEKWGEVDLKNQEILRKFLEEYGWPTLSVCNKNIEKRNGAETAAFVIAQHGNLSFMKEAFQRIQQVLLLDNSEISRSLKPNAAVMEDRILVIESKPQKFGSQISTKDGVTFIHPTEGIDMDKLMAGDRVQEEIIDSRRQTVGLEPIREYAAKHGVEIKIPGGKPRD